MTDNSPIRIYVNKIQKKIGFKIKSGYYLQLLTPETMKVLGITKNKINADKNGENVPHLEIIEVILVRCNIANNDHQHDSRVLNTFAPNKSFGQLLNISPKKNIFLKKLNLEFPFMIY